MTTESPIVWICAYAESGSVIDPKLVLSVFDAADAAFDLRLGYARGTAIGMDNVRARPARDWLERELGHIVSVVAAERKEQGFSAKALAMWVVSKQMLLWDLEWYPFTQYQDDGRWMSDPWFLFGVDIGLARESRSVSSFVAEVTSLLMADQSIWYAFIDPALRQRVPHSANYSMSSTLYGSGVRWEQLVEKDVWIYHQRGTKDIVRGVFWGNIFGRDFARRLHEAGFEERMQWLRDTHPWYPRVVDAVAGSMAVFLDEDPVGFAAQRESGFEADDSAVRGAGVLRAVLCRAGLL